MPFLHSTPFVFQHPSQLAHTIPRYAYATPTIQSNAQPAKPMNNMGGGLRGFYEHEEYERIEHRLLERIESLHKAKNSPMNIRKLEACKQQLNDCRDKLVRAREKFAREHESQRAPGTGEEDNVHDQSSQGEPYTSFGKKNFDSAVQLAPPDGSVAMSRVPSQETNDSAVSLHEYSSDEEGLKLAVRPKVRMDNMPYLSRSLLDCHSSLDADGFPYLTAQPTIIWSKEKQQWVEIRCNDCGAQSHDGATLRGMAGMLEHVRTSHVEKSS